MILPIHVVIPPGFREKNSTNAKNTRVNISWLILNAESLTIGAIPVVKETVAHLGIAKNGPIVRYRTVVNRTPNRPETLLLSCSRSSLCVLPKAATARIGMLTAVIIKPIIAGHELLPASCPRCTGKIRLPAPKNIPNKVLATTIVSLSDNFVFIITYPA